MCEKCQGRGFIEGNHGLIIRACDCEAGREYRARMTEILGIPTPDGGQILPPKNMVLVKNEPVIPLSEMKTKEEVDDSGIGQPDTDTGSGNTSEPKQPSKPKKKKRARKRAK